MMVTVALHAQGMTLAKWVFNSLTGDRQSGRRRRSPTLVMIAVVTVMLAAHFLEIVVWAVFFVVTDILPNPDAAMFFSINSYTALGASGIVLEGRWRGIAGIETMVSMLMFGWSTAVLANAGQKLQNDD
jgi:hypothetical protein